MERAQAERDTAQSCQTLVEKSGALAQAIGMRLPAGHILRLTDVIPDSPVVGIAQIDIQPIIEMDPAVKAADERRTEAQKKLDQARAGYYPTLNLVGRYDWVGERAGGYDAAVDNTRVNSYRVGFTLQQNLLPFTSETASVRSARADVIKADAQYRQTVIEVESRFRAALNATLAANLSKEATERSAKEAQDVVALSQSLYKQGRADLDTVDRARLTAAQAQESAEEDSLDALTKAWLAYKALHPDDFSLMLLQRGHIIKEAH